MAQGFRVFLDGWASGVPSICVSSENLWPASGLGVFLNG